MVCYNLKRLFSTIWILLSAHLAFSEIEILQSDAQKFRAEITPKNTEKIVNLNLGIPANCNPILQIINPETNADYPQKIQGSKVFFRQLAIGKFSIPAENIQSVTVEFSFPHQSRAEIPLTASEIRLYQKSCLNFETAKRWMMPRRIRYAKQHSIGGEWIKITIPENGLFSISGENLENLGYSNLAWNDLALFAPSHFGAPLKPTQGQIPESLRQVAIGKSDDDNGVLDLVENLVFYATEASGFRAVDPILISEIGFAEKFVELYNPTKQEIDLANHTILHSGSDVASWDTLATLSGSIPAFGFYLVATSDSLFTPDIFAEFSLANSGHIRLNDSDGYELDRVGWGNSTVAPEGNLAALYSAISIERRTNRFDEENFAPAMDTDENRLDFLKHSDFSTPKNSASPQEYPSPQLKFIRNPYSENNFYWLNIGGNSEPLWMETEQISEEPQGTIVSALSFQRHEKEIINPFATGLNWYGETLSNSSDALQITFDGEMMNTSATTLKFKANNSTSFTNSCECIVGNTGESVEFSRQNSHFVEVISNASEPRVEIDYSSFDQSGMVYLDWIDFIGERKLAFSENIFDFLLYSQTDQTQIVKIETDAENLQIYDISNPAQVEIIQSVATQTGVSFETNLTAGIQKRILLSAKNQTPELEDLGNYDLNAIRQKIMQTDYLIITTDDFYDAALELADFHAAFDMLSSAVVLFEDLANSFAMGIQDPHVIQHFLRWGWNHWEAPFPQYLFLFGDGDYDYRNLTGFSQQKIPPYEIETDQATTGSYSNRASDDHFGFINGYDRTPDIVIGRIPVRTAEEAQSAVTAIIDYSQNPNWGVWKNRVLLCADDLSHPLSNETQHINHTENKLLPQIDDGILVNKIYLTEYEEQHNASEGGVTMPKANSDLMEAINLGAVLINYVGHGSPTQWAQEELLVMDRDLENIQVSDALPFWIAATCDWARWDDPIQQSMAEKLLTTNRGIGVIAALRPVFGGQNTELAKYVFQQVFQNPQNYRIGDAYFIAKQQANTSDLVNDEKFHLLADPALKLAIPQFEIQLDSLDSRKFPSLSVGHASGMIPLENPLNETTIVHAQIFDGGNHTTRTFSDASVSYWLDGNTIFAGKISNDNQNFTLNFFVPKDISYSNEPGKIHFYAFNEALGIDGNARLDSIYFVGSDGTITDTEGPKIQFLKDERTISDGEKFNADEILTIQIEDLHGINLTQEIGHAILLTMDDDESNAKNITNQFSYETDSYQKGTVQFRLNEIETGTHEIGVTAWDSFNNDSENSIQISIVETENLQISELTNYPNPFKQSTQFYFYTNQEISVALAIFTVAGTHIQTIEPEFSFDSGYNCFSWDGRDYFGDCLANGIYLYALTAHSIETNEEVIVRGKLAVAN